METEDNDVTMRESFSLVQNILFIIDNTDILPAHLQENIVEKQWETWFGFLKTDSGGNS